MQQNEKSKLCPSCDGYISLDLNICPYCGNSVFDLVDEISEGSKGKKSKSLNYDETLSSLYPPPYKPKTLNQSGDEENESEEQLSENVSKLENEVKDQKYSILPITFLLLGINFLFFSIMLLAFSDDGFLYLKWKSKFWYLYTLFAAPFLYFGFKNIND